MISAFSRCYLGEIGVFLSRGGQDEKSYIVSWERLIYWYATIDKAIVPDSEGVRWQGLFVLRNKEVA